MNNKYLSKRTRIKGGNNSFISIIIFIACILLIPVLFGGLNIGNNSNYKNFFKLKQFGGLNRDDTSNQGSLTDLSQSKQEYNLNRIIINIISKNLNEIEDNNILPIIYREIFNKLSEELKKDEESTKKNIEDFILATKSFAYHYDGYLNAVLREIKYDKINLFENYIDISYEIEIWDKFSVNNISECNFEGEGENICEIIKNLCSNIKNPFSKYSFNIDVDGVDREKKNEYIQELYSFLPKIHNNLQIIKINIDEEITLYRGIKIREGSDINKNMIGFTSLTTDINTAIHLSISSGFKYNNFRSLIDSNLEELKIIIMKIKFPKNTEFIPIGLCTIQNESELILCQNGELEQISEENKNLEYWNDFVYKNKDGDISISEMIYESINKETISNFSKEELYNKFSKNEYTSQEEPTDEKWFQSPYAYLLEEDDDDDDDDDYDDDDDDENWYSFEHWNDNSSIPIKALYWKIDNDNDYILESQKKRDIPLNYRLIEYNFINPKPIEEINDKNIKEFIN